MHITKIVETAIYVQDLERSEAFYENTLGLEFESRQPGRHVFLKAGKSMLLIFNPYATLAEATLPAHGTSGVAHLAFEIEPDDYDQWKETLSQHRVPLEKEVTWPNGHAQSTSATRTTMQSNWSQGETGPSSIRRLCACQDSRL